MKFPEIDWPTKVGRVLAMAIWGEEDVMEDESVWRDGGTEVTVGCEARREKVNISEVSVEEG